MSTPNDFLHALSEQDHSPNTIRCYRSDLAQFAKWFTHSNGSPLLAHAVTAIDIKSYRAWLQHQQHAKPATINRKLAAINRFLQWAVDSGALEKNVAKQVSNIASQPLAPKWLTAEQQLKLLRTLEKERNAARTATGQAHTLRNYAIVYLMLNSGLRVSECFALTPADVTISPRKGSVLVRAGKGNKSRTVPLNKETRQVLGEWLQHRPASALLFSSCHTHSAGVRPFGVRGLQKLLAELGKQLDIPLTPHVLRHTCAKNLLDNGATAFEVATLLGHEKLDTTLRYGQPGLADLERITDKLS